MFTLRRIVCKDVSAAAFSPESKRHWSRFLTYCSRCKRSCLKLRFSSSQPWPPSECEVIWLLLSCLKSRASSYLDDDCTNFGCGFCLSCNCAGWGSPRHAVLASLNLPDVLIIHLALHRMIASTTQHACVGDRKNSAVRSVS